MSIQVVYAGTTVSFTNELAPDLPVRAVETSAIDKRRTFTGSYRQNVRYNKWVISFNFTGIDNISSQKIKNLVESDAIGTWSGFSAIIGRTAGIIYGKVPVDSYSHSETGFASYDDAFSIEEI